MSYKIAQEILWKTIVKKTKHKEKCNIISFLKKIPNFDSLTEWELAKLSEVLFERNYEVGEFIFEANQPGAALFLIKSGEIHIELERNSRLYTLATINENECIGDMALVDKSDRSASAKVVKKAQVFALYRRDLEKMMQTEPEIACKIYRSLAYLIGERLKTMNEMYKNTEVEPEKYGKVG